MRAGMVFALLVSLVAGAAVAQTPATESAAPSAAMATATAKPKAGGDTLSGVTVMPLPTKPCGSRDKQCIAMVVAELKRLYPEQLKTFCFAEQTKAARNNFVNQQLLESLNGNGPPTPTSFPVSAVVKTACAR